MKVFNRADLTNLKINTHFNFKLENNSTAELHAKYKCKSITDVSDAYNKIKNEIDEIEESIHKKISTINITMNGTLNNKEISKEFGSFHAFRDYLSTRETQIIDSYIRQCNFQPLTSSPA